MARQLTREAKSEILSNGALYVDVCEIINVKPASLPPLVYRNSPWLLNHDVVLRIASALKKNPDEILEEAQEPAAA